MKLLKLVSKVSPFYHIFFMQNYLGLNIRTIRQHWGLSQEEFGFLVNASRGMIMQYEKRGSMPKDETIERIIETVGLTKDVLVNVKLKRSELPSMPRSVSMAVENFRENPDEFEESIDLEEMQLPVVTHSQAQKALADKAIQNREKLDKTALEVLAMYVANPFFLLIGDHGRISVSEADHKTIARNAYSQASEMISESEQWIRVN